MSAASAAVNNMATSGNVAISGSGGSKQPAGPATDPQFGDVLKKIQGAYGAKAEKPREIKKVLGKDDFLRIMITQMKNQDPTNPFKAEQMATEMAQFTSVEQLQNLNQNMQKLMTANQPVERMAMVNLIGKSVTVDRDRFAHVEGQNESLSFKLASDAKEVRVAIVSDTGEVVLEKDLGEQKAGEQVFSWDGLKGNTLPAKSGNYMLRIQAKDEREVPIQTDGQRKVRVVGVSFEGGEPILLVGDNRNQEKVTMKSVIRIESDAGAPAPVQAAQSTQGGQGIQAPNLPNIPNFFSFTKGVGSGTIDPDTASALAKAQQAKAPPPERREPAAESANAESGAAEEKGFPNGLDDRD